MARRFEPFREKHLEEAASLLADRQRDHRGREPLLPAEPDFQGLVRAEFEGASGAVAFDGVGMAGYLIGKQDEDPNGPRIWSNPEGCAVREPDLVQDLYAHAAADWVEAGLTRHFVYAPADRDLLEAWFRLSFGASGVLALRASAAAPTESRLPDLSIRLSTPDDLAPIASLAGGLEAALNRAPSFSCLPARSDDALAEDWSDTWDDGDRYISFVAELDGRIVGQTLLFRRPADLRCPPGSIDLALAATDPTLRGIGIGTAMTDYVLDWAHRNGVGVMTTSWRMTNLLAARFWPRRGFREVFIRLYRSIP